MHSGRMTSIVALEPEEESDEARRVHPNVHLSVHAPCFCCRVGCEGQQTQQLPKDKLAWGPSVPASHH